MCLHDILIFCVISFPLDDMVVRRSTTCNDWSREGDSAGRYWLLEINMPPVTVKGEAVAGNTVVSSRCGCTVVFFLQKNRTTSYFNRFKKNYNIDEAVKYMRRHVKFISTVGQIGMTTTKKYLPFFIVVRSNQKVILILLNCCVPIKKFSSRLIFYMA